MTRCLLSVRALVVVLVASWAVCGSRGAAAMLQPRVVRTRYPSDSLVIASAIVNPPREGSTDATAAIQQAIDKVAKAGGGVVFLPAGRYRLEGRLVVKEGVTLRGDWLAPGHDSSYDGTTLAIVADRGNADAPAAITLERGSGIREIILWYPDQKPDAIVPYPWTIRTSRTVTGDNVTVLNVTLVNPYQAIQIGPEWNELHTLRNVYGTPLKTGIWVDTTTDIGRLIDVDFAPRWWAESRLPGAPTTDAERSALRSHLLREAVGLEMRRSDWEYVYRVRIQGYHVAAVCRPGLKGTANAVMFGCGFDGHTALRLEGLNQVGLAVTGCRLRGDKHGVHAPASFSTVAQFNHCTIGAASGHAILLEGKGTLTFQGCTLGAQRQPPVVAERGAISLVGCVIEHGPPHVRLGARVRRAQIVGTEYRSGPKGIENESRGDVQIVDERRSFAHPDCSPHPSPPDRRPATRGLFAVTDFGASAAAKDNTAAFAKALDAAREAGGGTVYVPAGNYRFAGELTVPTGVELRGCFDVPHHTVSGGSVLMPTAGRGSEDGTPFIRLEPKSGLRGLTVWYPEQNVFEPVAYPWTVRGLGPGCWLIDVTLGNAWQGVDLWTYPSTGHLVRYLAGACLKRGLFVSKSDGEGWVEDMQFNPHYSVRLHASLPRPKGDFKRIIEHQRRHLAGLVFGRCAREHVRGTFLYAAYDGIAFRDDGGGANARVIQHGSDTVSRAAAIEAAGEKGIEFIDAQLVPLSRYEKGAIVVADSFRGKVSFFNTQIWAGSVSGVIGGKGEVLIQQLNTVSGGFTVTGGRFSLENAHFTRGLSPHVRIAEGCERARLVANASARGAFHIDGRCEAVANSRMLHPPTGPPALRTGFEPGDPKGRPDRVAQRGGGIRKVSKATCRPVEGAAHAGKRALRIAGNADDPAYSYVYFQALDGPVALWDDTVLSYWIRPANARGRCVGVDLLFADGSTLRDSGARTADGQGVHPGGPKGAVGKWTNVTIRLGSFVAGKTVAAVLVAYDSRGGGGPFEAFIDDLAIERGKE